MLVELATEGDGQVAGGSGDGVSSKQGLATVIGATPALTDLHVLETRFDTGGGRQEIRHQKRTRHNTTEHNTTTTIQTNEIAQFF